MKFQIKSTAIKNGIIDLKYGSASEDQINDIPQISLPLYWENAPLDTKYYAITLIDYTNCELDGVPWIHWCIANIPSEITELKEDASRNLSISEIVQGKNSWITVLPKENPECNRYGGSAPLEPSEYEFKIYALSEKLNLEEGFYFNHFIKELGNKKIAESALYGTYEFVKKE